MYYHNINIDDELFPDSLILNAWLNVADNQVDAGCALGL